jgi:hypothetical protein
MKEDTDLANNRKGLPPPEMGYPVYDKVATDAGRNIIFAFAGTGVIWLLSRVWLDGARIAFWIALGVMALSIFHFLFTTVAGFLVLLSGRQTSRWVWAANAARLLEEVCCLVALWLAARAVGYWPLAVKTYS